ncbi:MAG: choice-of-anchor Q domain-containing protein [Bacteroidota bacterium]
MNEFRMKYLPQYIILLSCLTWFFVSSCSKLTITTDPGAILTFEVDTLMFDTVFTERGSATRSFKVFNPNSQAVRISSIMLGGGATSQFRLNIDGFPSPIVNDLEVAGEDSIWIFTEVTIDPDDMDAPFVVKDSVIFQTNGNEQKVLLEAFGQNANYIGESNEVFSLPCNNSVWDDPKPYVVLGFLVVDTCDLILPPGTRVHLQGGIAFSDDIPLPSGVIFVTGNASLKSNGTLNEPVVIRTDRIEPEFIDVPGQWGSIWLFEGSTGNEISYTTIRNSIVGIRVDSSATLDIDNSIIGQCSASGLAGRHATINGYNLLIFDTGSYNVQMEFGGDYNYRHCTFINLSANPFISHQDPVFRVSNYWVFEDDTGQFLEENDANVIAENCIIYGNRPEEIILDNPDMVSASINYTFNHCLVRVDTLDTSSFINPIINEDPIFVDPDELDYRLDTIISPAINAGDPNLMMPVMLDLDGNTRVDAPDIGCYEFQE